LPFFGRGSSLPPEEFFQDFFSKGFAFGRRFVERLGRPHCSAGKTQRRSGTDGDLTPFSARWFPVAEMDGGLREGLRTAQRQSVSHEKSLPRYRKPERT